MHAETLPGDRKCTNNILNNSNMSFSDSCRPCCEETALGTEDWVISLAELLSSTIWSESTVVNKAFKRLQNLVEQIGEGKSGAAHHELFRL